MGGPSAAVLYRGQIGLGLSSLAGILQLSDFLLLSRRHMSILLMRIVSLGDVGTCVNLCLRRYTTFARGLAIFVMAMSMS